MQTTDFLSDLNPAQREAVLYTEGPSLVVAGAGSGKTRVLTYKIAHLLTIGYKPWEIMALTFTNKAAGEMRQRISSIVGADNARYLHMGTFHSLFARILRSEANHIGFGSNFTIYDETDSRSLLKSIINALGLDDKTYKPSEVHRRISEAKNALLRAEDYSLSPAIINRDSNDKLDQVANIYTHYQQKLRAANAMDFDDLLLNTYLLFLSSEEVLEKYSTNLRYILVDEYQDTNSAQQSIITQLTSRHQQICAVGDDAQSIYAFRGAKIDNMLLFNKNYKSAKIFKLEQNYRSTQYIVQAANSLIKKNQRQIPKNVYSENAKGEKITIKGLMSDREEAAFICNEIKTRCKFESATFDDFAILYRTNYQSRAFEEQFLKSGVPYYIYGGMSFYQRKEIKDLVAYFRLVINNEDEEALRRIINYPARGIGATTIQKLSSAATTHDTTIWQILKDITNTTAVDLNKGARNKLTAFRVMIESFTERLETDNAPTLATDIVKQSGITADLYSKSEPEDISRQENLEEFLSSIHAFAENAIEEGTSASLPNFVSEVSLMSDREDINDDTPKVRLMTVHSSKGLEFPNVYIAGMEENIFPSQLCSNSIRELEEERRLLYVAITRAEKTCTLSYARSRYRYGNMEFGSPSRFLRDIDYSYTQGESFEPIRSRGHNNNNASQTTISQRQQHNLFGSMPNYDSRHITNGNVQHSPQYNRQQARDFVSPSTVVLGTKTPYPTSSISKKNQDLQLGTRVIHTRFGRGIISHIEGMGDAKKATVDFENVGTKQLLLKYAKLIVE